MGDDNEFGDFEEAAAEVPISTRITKLEAKLAENAEDISALHEASTKTREIIASILLDYPLKSESRGRQALVKLVKSAVGELPGGSAILAGLESRAAILGTAKQGITSIKKKLEAVGAKEGEEVGLFEENKNGNLRNTSGKIATFIGKLEAIRPDIQHENECVKTFVRKGATANYNDVMTLKACINSMREFDGKGAILNLISRDFGTESRGFFSRTRNKMFGFGSSGRRRSGSAGSTGGAAKRKTRRLRHRR
jgi:hypothetical protein